MYKFHLDKNQDIKFHEQKSAHNNFHEQISERDKFYERNQFHEDKTNVSVSQ